MMAGGQVGCVRMEKFSSGDATFLSEKRALIFFQNRDEKCVMCLAERRTGVKQIVFQVSGRVIKLRKCSSILDSIVSLLDFSGNKFKNQPIKIAVCILYT